MNIFNIISNGDQKINEPAVTAVLYYMLDSNYDHGLGSIVLDYLDKQAGIEIRQNKQSSAMEIEIELEEMLIGERGRRRDSDISIYCFNKEKRKEEKIEYPVRVYCIENKIANTSLDKNQMSDLYSYLKNSIQERYECGESEIANIEIIMVLVVPEVSENAKRIISSLRLTNDKHKKLLIEWSGKNSLLNLFQNTLFKNAIGKIPSLHPDFVFILKNFIEFGGNGFSVDKENMEGKFQGKFVYNFEEFLDNCYLPSSTNELAKSFHNEIKKKWKEATYRMAPKDRRITYAIGEEITTSTIFLQVLLRKTKIIFWIRFDSDSDLPKSKNFTIKEFKNYMYQLDASIESIANNKNELMNLIENSHSYVSGDEVE